MTTAFDQLLKATPVAPSVLRRRFRDWLTQTGWPADGIDELVLALNEAACNSVEHAYLHAGEGEDRPLRVHAELIAPPGELNGSRQVVLEVTDAGRWKPPPQCPRNRGRGLQMIRALAASVQIEPGPRGTRVRMVSRPAQPSTAVGAQIDQVLHRHTAPWPGPERQAGAHRSDTVVPEAPDRDDLVPVALRLAGDARPVPRPES